MWYWQSGGGHNLNGAFVQLQKEDLLCTSGYDLSTLFTNACLSLDSTGHCLVITTGKENKQDLFTTIRAHMLSCGQKNTAQQDSRM